MILPRVEEYLFSEKVSLVASVIVENSQKNSYDVMLLYKNKLLDANFFLANSSVCIECFLNRYF